MTATTTLTLAAFIEQRLAEDEAAARAAETALIASHHTFATYAEDNLGGLSSAVFDHIVSQDPARELRRCAAIREVLALHAECEAEATSEYPDPARYEEQAAVGTARLALRALAAIWADHEAYDPGWALS